jgi:hypothetical protein
MYARSLFALFALSLVAVGCAGGGGREAGPGRLPLAPRARTGSPLFVHYPDLDHHIVRIDPRSGEAKQTLYPDRWVPLDFVLDFVVDRDHLYALVGTRRLGTRRELVIVDLKQAPGQRTRVDRVALASEPQSLHWTCAGKLLVCHGTGAEGPAGRLSLIDPVKRKVQKVAPLNGVCTSVASAGDKALVLERVIREEPGGEGEVVVISSLAELDLKQDKVRRRELPPGSRQVIVGPSGLIYVSHASGLGDVSTDATVSVVAPKDLRMVGRLKQEMVVRRMAATPRYLVLNQLSDDGDPWVEIQAPDGTTLADFRLGELIGAEMVVLEGKVLAPVRRGSSLFRASLEPLGRLARLKIQGGHVEEDRPGLLRTEMSCDAR